MNSFPSFRSISLRSSAPFFNGIAGLKPKTGWMPGSAPSREQTAARCVIPGVTKDVHEQRVGAICAVELAPRAIRLAGEESRAGVDFGEPCPPRRLLQNSLVGSRQKITVFPSFILAVDDTRDRTVAHLRSEGGSPRGVSMAELTAQSGTDALPGSSFHVNRIGEN